jgi:hypothetical protein
MKTSELLEHITGPMLDDRAELLAGASDQLFKDSTVIRYLNEAERKLCRDAWVLEDLSTPAVCEVPLKENDLDYLFHESILHIKAVRLSDSDVDLLRVGYDDNRLLPYVSVADPDFWDVNVIYSETPGRPQRYSVDMGTRIIRVRNKPDAAAGALKLKLSVVRLPITLMSEENPDKEPEVPEEHHLELCKFAAGSCLANTADIDADLRSLGRAWVNEFNKMCDDAKRDRQRRQQSAPQFRFGGWARGYE